MKKLIVTMVALAGLLLAGCSTPATRIRQNPAPFEHATPAQQALIEQGKVALGFDEGMVQLALGKPDRIREKIDSTGRSVTWSYMDYYGYGYGYGYGGWYGYPGWGYGGGYDHGWGYGGGYGYGWDGGLYGYYPGNRFGAERERTRIVFQEDKVVTIEQER